MSAHTPIAVTIPAAFWFDHACRCPHDDERDMPALIAHSGNRVTVECNVAGLRGLLADARYYADADNMDECPRCIRESARRTVAALAKAGAA